VLRGRLDQLQAPQTNNQGTGTGTTTTPGQ
jgi:hypothetical protein